MNSDAFFTFSTLEHILSYFRLCWLILLHGSKSRRCHKRAVCTLAKGENVTHRFHVLLQGVNGHKCSQLCVCLRRLIIITVPPPPPHPPLQQLWPLCRSCCVLCHIPLRRSWTGCLVVHMHTHTRCRHSNSHTCTQRENQSPCQYVINLVYFYILVIKGFISLSINNTLSLHDLLPSVTYIAILTQHNSLGSKVNPLFWA